MPRISEYLSLNGAPSPAKLQFERRAHMVATPLGYLGFMAGYTILAVDHGSVLPRDNLYTATRVGKGGQTWQARKLRTMPKNVEHTGRSATKAVSSKLENVVRRLALDEMKEMSLLNTVGAERPELEADRDAQRAILHGAGLGRIANVLEAGREVVEPSATSAAALYGHLPFEKAPTDSLPGTYGNSAEATLIMRSMLSAHYYERAMRETDRQLFVGTVPELARLNRQPAGGPLDILRADTPDSLVASFMVQAIREYDEGADVLQKMGFLDDPMIDKLHL
jgi:hypothetical protein